MRARRIPMMSRTQSNQPRCGVTTASETSMLERLASEAFSRAMLSALFGMSIEKSVKATPVETKVPALSEVRSNFTLEQPGVTQRRAGMRRAVARRRSIPRP